VDARNDITAADPALHLRVSDADRDQAVAALSEHLQAGRLTAGEFDDRSGRALQARTGADLADLLTDLPPAGTTGRAGTPAAGSSPGGRSRGWGPGSVVMVLAVVAVINAVSGPTRHVHALSVLSPFWQILVGYLVIRYVVCGSGRRRSR
jgi:Domain of unknown function (DUF1707)